MARLSRLSRSVENHVALVTGAASGMGRATAHVFVDEGAHVAVTDLDENRIDSVVAEIVGAGGSANGWVLDVTDRDAVERVVPTDREHRVDGCPGGIPLQQLLHLRQARRRRPHSSAGR